MKKTDVFKLMLVFAMILPASAWISANAQEKKAGNSTGQNNNGQVGVDVSGNEAARIAEQKKLKMRADENLKREAIVKQIQVDAEQKEVAKKDADFQKKMELLKANEQAKENQPAPQFVTGTKELSAPEIQNQNNNPYTKYMIDYEHDASSIVASASNYDDAKQALFLLKEKHVAALSSNLDAQTANSLIAKAYNKEMRKLQEKLNITKN